MVTAWSLLVSQTACDMHSENICRGSAVHSCEGVLIHYIRFIQDFYCVNVAQDSSESSELEYLSDQFPPARRDLTQRQHRTKPCQARLPRGETVFSTTACIALTKKHKLREARAKHDCQNMSVLFNLQNENLRGNAETKA